MRLFVGIPVSGELKEKIRVIQKELEETGADLKLVEEENLHFTVKFLGEVEEEKVEIVKNSLRNVVEQFKSFAAGIGGVGFFPNEDYIRAIWLGVKGGEEKFLELLKGVHSSLEQIKEERRKPEAHLTIARMRNAKKKDLLKEKCKKVDSEVGEMEIKELVLYSSELTKKGPKYEVVDRFELK